ncbi:YcaO-like family protein [Streptomyces sp. NPDC056503]|uniref:YcaO-like family protein n=1 Tax=Streptomyces sp. NPDC056503 TaxID=3345842 RepID=UPI0036A33356
MSAVAAAARPALRARPVAETRRRLEPLIAARGITRVAELTGLDVLGVPVFSAIRPAAATLVASAGKGHDPDAAWVSAVMESLEVRAAERYRAPVAARGTARRVGAGYGVRDLALHPLSLVEETTTLEWTPALDLRGGRPGLVPAAAVGLRGWTGDAWCPPRFVTTSNGLAAGNDADEATAHALLELIERDALARADGSPRTPVAPASLGPGAARLAGQVAAAGGVLELERLTSLDGTTAFVCYLTQEEMPRVFGGTGCHVDAALAAERAILEAVQSRLSYVSGLRDDLDATGYRPSLSATARRSPRPVTDTRPQRTGAPGASARDVCDRLTAVIARHTERPVLRVDLTSPEEPFPVVVQTFAPGLRGSPSVPSPPPDEKVRP